MPDLLTPQALATAGPLVLETFFKHYLGPKSGKGESKAREDLMYDEAFVLMKTFLEIATKYPVAALQRFGLVRTPAPPWVALHRVVIPQQSLSRAADFLVEALGGEEMAYKVAGGTKWWQVRAGPGVEGEWIVLKKDWKEYVSEKERKDKEREQGGTGGLAEGLKPSESGEFRAEMDELRCMLYIHGGAYYWGSINTHRYTIWRYARKMHGRCFAVNYRKAPQYPFPCAIQDCLAAWLYLVNPPPEAKHKPVNPKNIILAGDSAGGGLVWALLQILRDTPGLELPAGAVLISPWSDLTHSFPSILKNTATDIVPPYGFIHKPSSLWPPPPPELTEEIQGRMRAKVREAVSRVRSDSHFHRRASVSSQTSIVSPLVKKPETCGQIKTSEPGKGAPGASKDNKTELHPMTEGDEDDHRAEPQGEIHHAPSRANPGLLFTDLSERAATENTSMTTLTQTHTPLKLSVEHEDVLIDTQIQLYATNAQLCHPWVSPVLGYLGGLPPLLIIAGDKEVLRDEIIYAAHKAAHPEGHPIRDDVRAQLPSLQGIEERYGPTNVHLQVYDGSCHDLPLFSMTKVARGVFRSISSFARFVTPSAPGSLSISKSKANSTASSGTTTPTSSKARNPTRPIIAEPVELPETFHTPPETPSDLLKPVTDAEAVDTDPKLVSSPRTMSRSSTGMRPHEKNLSVGMSKLDLSALTPVKHEEPTPIMKDKRQGSAPAADDAGPRFGDDSADQDSRAPPGSAGHSGIYRGDEPFTDHMIRERVAIDGTCRSLEPAEELEAMQMPRDEVGVIKEGPAIRYLNGQSLWDKRYSRAIKTVERHRKKNLKQAKDRDSGKITKMWQDKIRLHHHRSKESSERDLLEAGEANGEDRVRMEDSEGWQTDAASDHEDDRNPGRSRRKGKEKSVEEELMDQSWSWSWALQGEAPPPSAIVSRRDFGEARQLALMADRMDTAHESPIHGLSIWVGLAAFFSTSPERNRAEEALKSAKEAAKAEKATRGTLPGEAPIGKKAVRGVEREARKVEKEGVGALRRMSRIFGRREHA